jgi:hypothetical protein
VVVTSVDTNLSAAVLRTAGRARFAVKRHVKRRWTKRRGSRPSPLRTLQPGR